MTHKDEVSEEEKNWHLAYSNAVLSLSNLVHMLRKIDAPISVIDSLDRVDEYLTYEACYEE